jgi:hypothetical protein
MPEQELNLVKFSTARMAHQMLQKSDSNRIGPVESVAQATDKANPALPLLQKQRQDDPQRA